MKCDIIIPIWNQLEFTKDCIANIRKNTNYPYRLILVDNASDKETKAFLESVKNSSKDVELIRNEENLGFIKAVNQGLKISDAPYVCVLNNDTVPAPGWLEKMVDFAESHEDAGLINPLCNGHQDVPIDKYAKMLEKNKGKYMEMNQCQGYCMLVKRDLIDKVGYLDESYGIGGYDDTDYSIRAHKAGYKSVAIYDSYVYHRLHASFDKAGNREAWVKRNQKLYYDKWGKHLRVGIMLGLDRVNEDEVSAAVRFAYGLAREWTWVHIWINSRLGKERINKAIESAKSKYSLPPHQNLRVDHFDMPNTLFNLTILGKMVERLRKRMRDKKFDAVISCDNTGLSLMAPLAKLFNTQFLSIDLKKSEVDWEKRGRELARSIKDIRDGNGKSDS